MNFGEALKAERERKGLSLADLAQQTKVAERYLLALEAGDFAALPGGVFRRGIVRAYLSATGLDEELWLARLREVPELHHTDAESQEQAWEAFAENVKRSRISASRPSSMRWAGVVVLLVSLLVAAWLLWRFVLTPRMP